MIETDMTYTINRTTAEIDRVRNWAVEAEAEGVRHFPGMSYEDGVAAAIDWLVGDRDEAPDEA
jgi:hypothetical protein